MHTLSYSQMVILHVIGTCILERVGTSSTLRQRLSWDYLWSFEPSSLLATSKTTKVGSDLRTMCTQTLFAYAPSFLQHHFSLLHVLGVHTKELNNISHKPLNSWTANLSQLCQWVCLLACKTPMLFYNRLSKVATHRAKYICHNPALSRNTVESAWGWSCIWDFIAVLSILWWPPSSACWVCKSILHQSLILFLHICACWGSSIWPVLYVCVHSQTCICWSKAVQRGRREGDWGF